MGTTTAPARLHPHERRTCSTGPYGDRLHQLVGRQRQQSPPIPPLALDTDPAYRLARLSDQMIGSGLVAGWNMNKDTAFKALPFN